MENGLAAWNANANSESPTTTGPPSSDQRNEMTCPPTSVDCWPDTGMSLPNGTSAGAESTAVGASESRTKKLAESGDDWLPLCDRQGLTGLYRPVV